MKMRLCMVVCMVLLTAVSALGETIEVSSASVRSKPGAFYPVVATLKKGTFVDVLENKGRWCKVKAPVNVTGWLSANALKPQEKAIDYGLLSVDTSGKRMATIMVTAAVKGFFENPVGRGQLNKQIFESPFVRYIVPEEYEKFKKETFSGRRTYESFLASTNLACAQGFQLSERMIATSAFIAGRLAEPGLVQDRRLVTYVNNLAQLIAESSEFYDLPVSVHVVNTDRIFANATPIGVILISKGMLDMVRSENELACLLGHEISHITLQHGMTEASLRRSKIDADDAFAEMGDELGVGALEMEMDDLALAMFERAIRGRKEAYEMEADGQGILYARRAGYDPSGMSSLLNRLKPKADEAAWEEDPSHWLPSTMDRRIEKLPTRASSKAYLRLGSRYHRYVN